MAEKIDDVRKYEHGREKLGQAVNCLIGSGEPALRLQDAVERLAHLTGNYEGFIPPEMREELTDFMESMVSETAIGNERLRDTILSLSFEEMDRRAEQILSFYEKAYQWVEDTAKDLQKAYTKLEREKLELLQGNRELKEEFQSLKDFLPLQTKRKWRADRLGKMFKKTKQSGKPKPTRRTAGKTKKSGNEKGKNTPTKNTKRKPKSRE